MTMKLFSRKNKKANKRRNQRPEMRVIEGVDFARRERLWSHICKLRREMLITTDPDNKKALSTY